MPRMALAAAGRRRQRGAQPGIDMKGCPGPQSEALPARVPAGGNLSQVDEEAPAGDAEPALSKAVTPTKAGGKSSRENDIIYGIINAVVGLPTMISFAAIVYSVRCPGCVFEREGGGGSEGGGQGQCREGCSR